MVCQNCRTQNYDNADFCRNCGNRLRAPFAGSAPAQGNAGYGGVNYGVPNGNAVAYNGYPKASSVNGFKKHTGVKVTTAIMLFLASLLFIGDYLFWVIGYNMSWFGSISDIFFNYIPPVAFIVLGIFLIASKNRMLMTIPLALMTVEWFGKLVFRIIWLLEFEGSFDPEWWSVDEINEMKINYIVWLVVMALGAVGVTYLITGLFAKPLYKAWFVPAILLSLTDIVSLYYLIRDYIDIVLYSYSINLKYVISDIIALLLYIVSIATYFLIAYALFRVIFPAKASVRPAMNINNGYAGNGYAAAANGGYYGGANVGMNNGYHGVQNGVPVNGYQNIQNGVPGNGYQNVQNGVPGNGYQNVQSSAPNNGYYGGQANNGYYGANGQMQPVNGQHSNVQTYNSASYQNNSNFVPMPQNVTFGNAENGLNGNAGNNANDNNSANT